eukprot:jgi/Galph1/974/GphlegSOOS_G5612.1
MTSSSFTFQQDVLYRPLTRTLVRSLCHEDHTDAEEERKAAHSLKNNLKRIKSGKGQHIVTRKFQCSKSPSGTGIESETNNSKSLRKRSLISEKRQKKLKTWIAVEALPVLLESVFDSIPEDQRALYDSNKIQDFILGTVSNFRLGISSLDSRSVFEYCRQYLVSHTVNNPAFHSSFRVDFRSPVSVKSSRHFMFDSSAIKGVNHILSIDEKLYDGGTEQSNEISADCEDVLDLHFGLRRLTRTLYQTLRSIESTKEDIEENQYEKYMKRGDCESSSCLQQSLSLGSVVEDSHAVHQDTLHASTWFSVQGNISNITAVCHGLVRFLPVIYQFFESHAMVSERGLLDSTCSVQLKTCLISILIDMVEKEATSVGNCLSHEPKSSGIETRKSSRSVSNKRTKLESLLSKSTCAYELARKDRIRRNEQVLRQLTSDSSEPLTFLEKRTEDTFSVKKVGSEWTCALHDQLKASFWTFLKEKRVFYDSSEQEMLMKTLETLMRELDSEKSHNAAFYSLRRVIRRMERVIECCSENKEVEEAIRRYLRVVQSQEYRERRNLFTMFRGPWNDENKNALFFQAWEKHGNGRDANKLIAMEMGSDVHPNQVAYMKSLYPGWLQYKQMLASSHVTELYRTQEDNMNATSNSRPVHCAFCAGGSNVPISNQIVTVKEGELNSEIDLGHLIGPLRFSALNSIISSSSSSFSSNSGYYVHYLCALWAPEVFEAFDGTLLNISQAIQRARHIFCCYCRRKGASLGCRECKRCYHAPKCALLAGCYLDTESFQLLCPLHARVEAAVERNTMFSKAFLQ